MSDKKFSSIDDYIRTFPHDVVAILEKIRQTIRKAVPDAVETISYNMPTFDLEGEHLVFFAGWKNYVSLYPLPAGDSAFQQKVAPYKKEKSTLRFPLNEPIPYDLIEEIVTLLIKERQTVLQI